MSKEKWKRLGGTVASTLVMKVMGRLTRVNLKQTYLLGEVAMANITAAEIIITALFEEMSLVSV